MRTLCNRRIVSVVLTVALAAGFMMGSVARAGTVVSAGIGNWDAPATWTGGVPDEDSDVFIQSGHTVTITGLVTRTINSLSITGNLTHAANSSVEAHKIILDVTTDFFLHADGTVDLTGRGYAAGQGPGSNNEHSSSAQLPGTYGGKGRHDATISAAPTYGSITAPTDLGSGGREGAGGGCVILNIGGIATIDGDIITEGGVPAYDDSGSGGSIFITTGGLSGSGTLNCNGSPYTQTAAVYGPGGGRIAVILTNSADFGDVVMTAYGNADGIYSGGAGTVYLRDTNSVYGRLIVDNGGRTTTAATLISHLVTDTEVGDVIIRNSSRLQIGTDQSLTVHGSWSNASSFVASSGSTVTLAGSEPATLWGDSTFASLIVTNAGKVVRFEEGKTQTISSGITFKGAEGNLLTLESRLEDSPWYLNQNVDSIRQGARLQRFGRCPGSGARFLERGQ